MTAMQGNIPPGWAPHTTPGYIYELANTNNVHPFPSSAAQPAPTVAPQQSVEAMLANVQSPDVEEWMKRHDQSVRQTMGWTERDKNVIFVDFGKQSKQMSVGEECAITIRLLPDLKHGDQRDASIAVARHRMLTSYIPDYKGDKQWTYPICYNNIGGPGNCPICLALEAGVSSQVQGIEDHFKNFKPKTTTAWKCVLLDDPTKHYVPMLDPDGNVIIGADGQPTYKMVPGIIRMGRQMYLSLQALFKPKGFPTHHQNGYPVYCVKKKTGPDNMNVVYNVVGLDPCPIDPQLYPILQNDVDLRKEVLTDRYWKAEDMQGIAQGLMQKAQVGSGAVVAQGDWVPHPQSPGHEYNTSTRAVRPVQAAPAPPAPLSAPVLPPPPDVQQHTHQQAQGPTIPYPAAGLPAAPSPALPAPAPAAPAVSPPTPVVAPPGVQPPSLPGAPVAPPDGAPPPPPSGLPPVGAPGLAPGQVPQGIAPPPAPGMPPGTHPVADAPPPPPPAIAPPAVPGAPPQPGMSPDQLEQSMGGTAQTDIPF